MRLRTALLATTILALPGVASAQNYNPNLVRGVYIAAGAGVNWLNDTPISSSGSLSTALGLAGSSTSGNVEYDVGWVGVVSLGYGFGNGVRVEIEGNYRQNDVSKISGFNGQTSNGSGRANSYGVMANAFYDFDLGQGGTFGGFSIVPYVGIGAGYIWREYDGIRANVLGGTVNTSGTDGRFAYQAIAGVAVPLTQWAPGLAFTAEYRFLGTLESDIDTSSGGGTFSVSRGTTKSENYNNSILIGLRYAFNAAPPPPPVVAPAAAPAPARTYLVFFDWNRADLTDRARQIIDEAATNAQRAGSVTRIEVSGHADRSGTPQYNQRLSERRAQVVAQELERRGIPRSAMVIQGFGETRPLVPTADGVREPQNRRVEIVLR
ncbi:OmpA family protein [Falsiroseomonas sp. HW251]|uniref:OmpA family protein n=1 Tax=Falsiroseomonas sp. HW251 TaxID=3390998 RepID=UPI003D3112AE